MKVLVVMELKDHHLAIMKEDLKDHELIINPNPSVEDLKDADVIIGNIDFSNLKHCENLKLLQLNTAGADAYCNEGVLPAGTILTNATGAYGVALAEYTLATIFAMMKHLPKYYLNQQKEKWEDLGEVDSILGSTFLLVGFGDIGEALGKRLYALGGKVNAIKRRLGTKPSYINEWGTLDDLYTFAKESDVVIGILPGSDATTNVFDKEFFAAMKKGSYFVNVGRGLSVVEEDLINALNINHLKAAALDVMQIEPLPKDSPLWHTKNLYLTPHTAGQYHLALTHDKIVRIAINNVIALEKGEELRNVVDLKTGYKK